MKTKLTLQLDRELVRRAKQFAAERGKSVSQLVADYFSVLGTTKQAEEELTPTVRDLKGSLHGRNLDSSDYRKHLERKYL